MSGAFWRKTDETKTKVIAQNIITNIYEKNEVAAGEVTGVSHLSKTLKGAGSIVSSCMPVERPSHVPEVALESMCILAVRPSGPDGFLCSWTHDEGGI
jgi:hypothetical protein